jgi:hypothetical protein
MGLNMDLKRREIIGILGAGAAGAVVTRVVEGQTPQAAPPPSPDAELQAARQGLQRDAQRIAMVNLPQATEPAFRFRA